MVAQEPPVPGVRIDAVHVSVTVTDRSGRLVPGLTADQFEISVGSARRPVLHFSADRAPISLGILLDISGDMTDDPKIRAYERARWAHVRRGLELLVTRLDAADEMFFAVFNERIAAASWTHDHTGLLREFDALRPGGGNALLDAVPAILPTFELARYQRKVLLLLTSGNDTNVPIPGVTPSSAYDPSSGPPGHGDPLGKMDERETTRHRRISRTKSALRGSDVMLYAIGIGSRKGEPVDTVLLEGLIRESGGYVEPLRDPTGISAAVGRLCDELQSQYLLAFEPARADGSYHAIRVRTKDTRLRVRARPGYIAVSGAP
jgi:Ca-activated chloride channel family protein